VRAVSYLPLANILHHKLRSALSALGIGISVCMLVTLAGLSRGSVNEVLDRWNGVDADLIVCPGSTNITLASGPVIPLATIDRIEADKGGAAEMVEHVAPAYLARMKVTGQELTVFGIRPADFDVFGGKGRLLKGRLPDEKGKFAAWIEAEFEAAGESGKALNISDEQLEAQDAWEMAIDTRLAAMLHAGVDDKFYAAGHSWKIVGIFEAGAVSRAVASMAALQYLFNGLDHVTLLFVKLRPDVRTGPAAEAIRKLIRQNAVPKGEYQGMLMQNMGIMYTYVDAVNVIALVIAFLFIMVTLYTMVLQRTRDIAILKSLGASRAYLLRQVLAESLLLTAAGAAAGIAFSFGAAWLIRHIRADLTVDITPGWVGVALCAAAAGGLLAGLYPAWRASRVDVAESLTLE
jgi:putative ABC transport system permease protein